MTIFTIKHIAPDGIERIWAARGEIEFTPRRPSAIAIEMSPATVTFIQPNGILISIESGSVYVLNSEGRTVARYHLNEPKVEARPTVRAA